jgi:hypothetical protein
MTAILFPSHDAYSFPLASHDSDRITVESFKASSACAAIASVLPEAVNVTNSFHNRVRCVGPSVSWLMLVQIFHETLSSANTRDKASRRSSICWEGPLFSDTDFFCFESAINALSLATMAPRPLTLLRQFIRGVYQHVDYLRRKRPWDSNGERILAIYCRFEISQDLPNGFMVGLIL